MVPPKMRNNMSVIDQVADPVDTFFGQVVYPPGGTCGPRVQPDVQLVLLLCGSLRVAVEGRWRELPVGHVSCMLPGRRELYRFDRRCSSEHLWVSLRYRPLDTGTRRLCEALPFELPITPRLRALWELGRSWQGVAGDVPGQVRRRVGTAALLAFAESANVAPLRAASRSAPLSPAVRSALDCIAQRHTHPLSLDHLADAAHVTPSHLIRLFRHELRTTPMRALWRRRVDHGVELLRDTGLSVSEVAYAVGFASPTHFSRLVQQQRGAAPRELRRRLYDAAADAAPDNASRASR